MQTAEPGADARRGRIELPGFGLGRGQAGEPGDGGFLGCLNRLLDLVEALAGRRLVGLVDLAEAFLDGLQAAALRAEEFNASRFKSGRIASGSERGRRLRFQLLQF